MEYNKIMQEFFRQYWDHYLILEGDFLATARYLTIADDNANAYSNEYFKLYQSIGSEIDVVAKRFCKFIEVLFNKETIHHYCKTITDRFTDFTGTEIYVNELSCSIKPWLNWAYTSSTNKNGKVSINGTAPKWWTLYNKTKHERTTAMANYGNKPFYKFANQENIMHALSGLYQLNMFYFFAILEKIAPLCVTNIIIKGSKLFCFQNWSAFFNDHNCSIYTYDKNGKQFAIKE